jgi:outer membrane protein assembly factor BamB
MKTELFFKIKIDETVLSTHPYRGRLLNSVSKKINPCDMYKLTFFFLVAIPSFAQIKPQPDFDKQPTVQWRFKIRNPIFSSPVIEGNIVYFGGLDSTLYALDLQSGKEKWRLKTNGEIRSTVSIYNDKLYLLGGNGVLSCIDKWTGKAMWRSVFDQTAVFLSERKYDFADYYHSSPVIYNDVIYFGSGNGYIRAVKTLNGEQLWSFKTGDIVHNTPVIYKDKLYIGSFDGNLYALNLQSGAVVWKFKSIGHQFFPLGEMQGSPAAGLNGIFIGSRDFNVYAINANEGYAHWNKRFQGGWALSNTIKDTVLYMGTSDDRILLAADARNGRELWKANVKFNIFGNCAFTASMVYVGTIWGKLFGIDQQTGAIKWSLATEGFTLNHPHYFKADDTFRDDIGDILRAPVDWIKAEYKMGGIFSTPAIAGDLMVITTTEGIVYGLRRN